MNVTNRQPRDAELLAIVATLRAENDRMKQGDCRVEEEWNVATGQAFF